MSLCVECKEKTAFHWNRSFCEDCMNVLLVEKVKEEDSDAAN